MQYSYLKRISKFLKTFIQSKYSLTMILSLLLLLSTTVTLVSLNYNQILDENPQQEIEETEEEVTPEEDIPISENIEEEAKVVEEEEKTPSKTIEKTTPKPETETPTETETPAEQPPEEEPTPEPAPPESPSAVVAFYADTQSDTDQEDINHQRVVNYILSSGANPVFHAGDVMEDGTEASLIRFNNVTSTLRSSRTFYAALGNNDRTVGDSSTPSQLFLNNFVFPNNEQWYSVNYGNLHLIVLDSAFSAGSATQLNWLASDLQSSNSQNRITGVMYHHPTFFSTISSHLINYGADFTIAGHVHSYSHSVSSGINSFTLSGQPSIGYMIARIYSDTVSITVYNSSNGVIDSVEFSER